MLGSEASTAPCLLNLVENFYCVRRNQNQLKGTSRGTPETAGTGVGGGDKRNTKTHVISGTGCEENFQKKIREIKIL